MIKTNAVNFWVKGGVFLSVKRGLLMAYLLIFFLKFELLQKYVVQI